eukprot:TRINITY_DN3762_c0_g1_i1.p1 TRINITY_DN3762_c0_g1~~TRINITY_DN3762_c0_g1_i1.p1  ORF type:complete len:218 (-),score=33.95 TRINITY_DN3762_c0_g1_i1:88-741(-)
MKNQHKRQYKKFVFLNFSVIGPFVPLWSNDCWLDAFAGELDDQVKVVGTVMACLIDDPRKHMHSMIIATDDTGLSLMWRNMTCASNLHEAIFDGEVQITMAVLNGGYSLTTANPFARRKNKAWVMNCTEGDSYYGNRGIGGGTYQPYELVFIKTEQVRNMNNPNILRYASFADGAGYNANRFCKKKRRNIKSNCEDECLVTLRTSINSLYSSKSLPY